MKYLNKFILNENVAQANSLLKRLKISEKDPDYIKLREMLQGHDGYVYWFTKLRFSDNQTMEDIKTIWDLIKDPNGITSFFTKKIVDLESVEDFWDQYEAAKILSLAKKVLNQFPSKQKAFFNLKDTNDLDLLTQLGKSKSLTALIRKISSFRDKKSLLDAANRLLTSSFDGKFGELIKKINSVGSNIVVADEENNIIVCQVDYEQIRVLGGDTSWCIVRAKSTFDSYANGGFQWVIFLVDESDRYSKIGLTTNTGYNTAHDKYDGYIDKAKIQKILKDRGVELSDLYISKEVLLGMSNWDLIPVETLIEKNISKQEIVKRKLVFKRNYNRIAISNTDISFFTDEEVEKWNLHERTELNWADVAKMTFDDVIRTKALNRLTSVINFVNVVEQFKLTKEQVIKYEIYDIKNIGNNINTLKFFTKDEIIKYNIIKCISNRCIDIIALFEMDFTKEEIIKYKLFSDQSVYITADGLSYFTKEELIKYKIINNVSGIPFNVFINIGFTKDEIIKKYSTKLDTLSSTTISFFKKKTRKQVLSRLFQTFWSDDLKELGIDRNDRGELNKFKMLTMSIYDIDSKDVPLVSTKRGDVSLTSLLDDRLDINKENINTLITLGYKPNDDFNNFTELFIKDSSYGNIYKTYNYSKYRELFKDNKELYDLCTKKLMSSLSGNIDCDYFDLIKYKDVLSKMPEYDILLNKIKSSKSIWGLKTKSSDSSSNYSYDMDRTIDFIKELKFTKSEIESKGGISKFCEAFEMDRLYNRDIDKAIDFFKSYGFKIDEDEEINIIGSMLKFPYNNSLSNGTEIKIYKEDYYRILIERGIKVEDSLDALFNYYYKLKNSNSEESSYRQIFSKGGEKYIKMFELETINIKERELNINVIKGLNSLFTSRYSDEKDKQNWYDKYFSIYVSIPASSHKWDKFQHDIRVIWVLASLNKFDDFNKMSMFDFSSSSNRGFSFDDNQIHSFAKGLCGKARDIKEVVLTNSQLGEIYKWLLTKVDTSKVFVNKYLLVCYYLYENKRYEDFINNKLNTIKNNYGSSKITLRLDILRYILKYFREQNDFDDFKGLLDKFFINLTSSKVNKMGINEYKRTIKYLDDNFETTRTEFGKKVGDYIKEIQSKYSKVFLKPVKESFILKWSEFK